MREGVKNYGRIPSINVQAFHRFSLRLRVVCGGPGGEIGCGENSNY
jgi:hypothetical protein